MTQQTTMIGIEVVTRQSRIVPMINPINHPSMASAIFIAASINWSSHW